MASPLRSSSIGTAAASPIISKEREFYALISIYRIEAELAPPSSTPSTPIVGTPSRKENYASLFHSSSTPPSTPPTSHGFGLLTPTASERQASYKNMRAYFVLSGKEKKFQSERRSPGEPLLWDNVNFSLAFFDEKDAHGEVKITFYNKDKWKKDKYIGEATINLESLLHLPHNAMPVRAGSAKDSFTPEYAFEAILNKKRKKSDDVPSSSDIGATPSPSVSIGDASSTSGEAEITTTPSVIARSRSLSESEPSAHVQRVRIFAEVSGWQILQTIFKSEDPKAISKALFSWGALAESKEKKFRGYLRKDMLRRTKSIALSSWAPEDLKEQVATTWGKIARRDDESLNVFVKEKGLSYLAQVITKLKETKPRVAFIDQLKPFFKYVSHQKTMISKGILKQLIQCISSSDLQVQIKAFDVLLHFDGEHQAQMIREGILPQLSKLIFAEDIQVQTRALALIQYFDKRHQTELVRQKVLQDLMNLLEVDKTPLQLKVLSVIQHFDTKFYATMIKEGLLVRIANLMRSANMQLKMKSFEVAQLFVEYNQEDLINAGILQSLIDFLKTEDVQVKMKVLDITSKFDAAETIQRGYLHFLMELILGNEPGLQSKSLEILANIDDSLQDEMVKEGILTRLVDLMAVETAKKPSDVPTGNSETIRNRWKKTAPGKSEADSLDDIMNELETIMPTSPPPPPPLPPMHMGTPPPPSDLGVGCAPPPKPPPPPHIGIAASPSGPMRVLEESADDTPWIGSSASGFGLAQSQPFESSPRDEDQEPRSGTSKEEEGTQKEEVEGKPKDEVESAEKIEKEDGNSAEGTKEEVAAERTDAPPEESPTLLDSTTAMAVPENSGKKESASSSDSDPYADFVYTPMGKEENTAENSTPRRDSFVVPEELKEWSCLACTFANTQMDADCCEICGTTRAYDLPHAPPSSLASSPPPETVRNGTTEATADVPSMEKPFGEEETKVEPVQLKKKLSSPLQVKVLDILRNFREEFQQEMISQGLLTYLKILLDDQELQSDVVRTLAFFNSNFHQLMIKEGILTRIVEIMSSKNAKLFLLAVEKFEGYQDHLIKQNLLKPIVKLLSVDDVQIQSRICDFIINFDVKHRHAAIRQIKAISGVSDSNSKMEETASPPAKYSTYLSAICKQCGGIGDHLTTCSLRQKKWGKPTGMKIPAPMPNLQLGNYSLISQAKKLLWQLEHNGIRLLKYKVIHNDGGEFSKKYRVKNLLTRTFPQTKSQWKTI